MQNVGASEAETNLKIVSVDASKPGVAYFIHISISSPRYTVKDL